MGLYLVTPPTVEPVTVDEIKVHCRIDSDDEDVLIGQLIVAARRFAETKLNRQLCTATWRLYMDRFPCWQIDVPNPPLVSVTTLTYTDTGGTTQTLTENTHFIKDIYSEPGRITPAYGQSWPSTRDVMNSVALTYVAGYGDPDDVPEEIRHWMKLRVAHLYEHREQFVVGVAINEVPQLDHLLMSCSWGCIPGYSNHG